MPPKSSQGAVRGRATRAASWAVAALTAAWTGCGESGLESTDVGGQTPDESTVMAQAPAQPGEEALDRGRPDGVPTDAPEDGQGGGYFVPDPDADEVPRFAYQDGDLARCYQGAYQLAKGDLHAHTSHSDGAYEPSDAFSHARGCGMQFFAVTDHSKTLSEAELAQCRNQAASATSAAGGTFVAFCGFEVEPDKGHANVFFTADEWEAANRDDFANKLNGYSGQGIPAQINHPCTDVVDNQWGAFAYREAIDDNMALMEFSGGGSFACKLAEYRYLLNQGYHLAPSSNGDKHGDNYNWCNEPQHRTGLWVSALTPDGVRVAIRQRRSFAAPQESQILLLADGCWMGSVIGGVSTAGISVQANHGPGLAAIHLIGNGGTIHSCGCAGPSCSCNVDVSVGNGSYVFAYADRVDNAEEPLVAAPVWFRTAPTCSGECVPGQTATQPCGNCGTQVRRCLGNCSWSPWSGCANAGACSPGQTESGGCNDCGAWSRQCQADCNWGGWSACQGSGATETIGCGNCGQMTVQCGLDGVASVLTGCEGEGVCPAGTVESQPCCDCGTTQRLCNASCQWSGWTECAGADPAGGTQACSTGLGGLCDPGIVRCNGGCTACEPTSVGSPELCDGVDNDCNAAVDDGNPTTMGALPPPFAAVLSDASYPARMAPGESAIAWVEFENVGTEPWAAGDLLLVTDNATAPCLLRDAEAWPAFDVAAVLADDVLPEEHGSFVFSIALDADAREPVTESLRLARASGETLRCPEAHVTLTVRPEISATSAAPPSTPTPVGEEGGCGCRVAGRGAARSGAPWVAVALAALLVRRRRRPSQRTLIAGAALGLAALSSGCGSEATTSGFEAVGGAGASTSSSAGGSSGAPTTSSSDTGGGGQGGAVVLGGPPYAVVLAHGFFGADTWAGLDFFQYFYQVKDYLAEQGETQIYTPAVDPFNSSEARGAQLAAAIEEIRLLANSDKVNIIGHSQGGLDARLVAHEHPEWVASVVTFATPHRGSPIADVALGEQEDPNYLGVLDSLLATVGRSVWDQWGEETSLATALRSFTTGAMVEFNDSYTDQESVYYASFAGRSDRHDGEPLCAGAAPEFVTAWEDTLDPIDAMLAVPEMVLDGGLGAGNPNDGLVTVESARWGRFLGCVPADHIDEVGQVLGDSPGLGNDWDHKQFYAGVVALLRQRGL